MTPGFQPRPPQTTLPVINAFWVGDELGVINVACLRSWLAAGHRVVLHAYQQPHDRPEGVDAFDANRLLARDRVLQHARTNSWALGSDIYRYEILAAGMGVYVDADVYCLKPLEGRDFIFGWEDATRINGAVLTMPADSDLLNALRDAAADPHFIGPWRKGYQRAMQRARQLLNTGTGAERLTWGTLGPRALTWYARQFGHDAQALPRDTFYPLHYTEISRLVDANVAISDIATERTVAIHFYAQALKPFLKQPVPPASPLGTLLATR